MPRILLAFATTLIIASSATAYAGNSNLSGAIREATGLAPAYQFAARCVADGEVSPSDLASFRDQLLHAIEEKYTLEFDQVTVAETFLTGDTASELPLIYPSSGNAGLDSCANATSLM